MWRGGQLALVTCARVGRSDACCLQWRFATRRASLAASKTIRRDPEPSCQTWKNYTSSPQMLGFLFPQQPSQLHFFLGSSFCGFAFSNQASIQ